MHDISYEFGFTEEAGNFQKLNYGGQGAGGDAVEVIIRKNHKGWISQFATPLDGQPPILILSELDDFDGRKSSALDNTVIIHEYAHGISNRLVGGRFKTHCLTQTASGGLGEGWSDAFAFMLTMRITDDSSKTTMLQRYTPIPAWSVNNAYSLESAHIQYPAVGGINIWGRLWATVLYDIYWALVDKHGFSEYWLDSTQKQGNIIMMKIMVAAMKLQPCNPSFIDARNAFLQAEELYYNGVSRCVLWKSFAKRGLGATSTIFAGSNAIPRDCVH